MRGQKFLKSLGSGPYTPPNQLAHDTVVTPGTRSISARSAVGSGKMNDTRCRTIMRLAEEPATPAFQAPTMVRSRPNAITAVAIPRIVRIVRSLWRKALRKMIDRIFMGPRLLQLALVEVAHNVRPLGGVRIMGDHDDGLFEFLVEALEQGENLLRRLAVEIARGLIRHEDRGVGGNCPCDGDALLLPARKLPRIVLGAVGEAHERQRRIDVLLALLLAERRQ